MDVERKLFLKERFLEIINSSQNITVLTGAGISVGAGIPDFRGENGLWSQEENIERAVSLSGFIVNPERFWKFWFTYWHNLHQKYQPTTAHQYLAQLEQNTDKHFTIITQNIDGLHEQAGSKNVLAVHGSTILPLKCIGCHNTTQWSKENEVQQNIEHFTCKECGDYLKPQVILFEEQLDQELWNKTVKAVKETDLLICIGTSLIVEPVASLPKKVIHHPKKKLICIGKGKNQFSSRSNLNIETDIEEFFGSL